MRLGILFFLLSVFCDYSQAYLNAGPALSTKEFSQAHTYTVLVSVTKSDDFGACTGALIHRNFIITAAHCLDGAIEIETYFVYPESETTLRNFKVRTVDWKIVVSRELGRDIGIILIDDPPTWAKSIELVDFRHSHEPATTFLVGFEHLYSKYGIPYGLSNARRLVAASVLSIQSYGLFGYLAELPTYQGQQTASCKGDSGGPVVSFKNDKLVLSGVIHSGAGDGTALSNIRDPKSKTLEELNCSPKLIYGDLGRLVGSIYKAEGELLRKNGK